MAASQTFLEKTLDLPVGTESGTVELMCIKDGWPVTLSIAHLDDGYGWELLAEWEGHADASVDPWRIARTFTRKKYAADWIRAHVRLAGFTLGTCHDGTDWCVRNATVDDFTDCIFDTHSEAMQRGREECSKEGLMRLFDFSE